MMDILLPKPEQIVPNKINNIHSAAFNSRYLFWQDIKGERLNISSNSETRICNKPTTSSNIRRVLTYFE